MQSSATINQYVATSCLYYCDFLAKHKDNVGRSDELSRWWPDWYRYTKNTLTGDIIFGVRILLRLNITPDHTKYIQWYDTLNLINNDTLLHGPFDFFPVSSNNCSRNIIASTNWLQLGEACARLSILPPTIGPPKRFNPSLSIRNRRTSKRKRNSWLDSGYLWCREKVVTV